MPSCVPDDGCSTGCLHNANDALREGMRYRAGPPLQIPEVRGRSRPC
jgi:hypothetical protein